MDTSSSSFQGTGVKASPAAAPAPHAKKSRRVNFMLSSFVTSETANFYLVPVVAVFAVAHLHAVARCPPQARHGVSPEIAAIAADPVDLVQPDLIRLPIVPVAFGAGQPPPFHMDSVREPHIGRLPRIDQPRCGRARLDVAVHERRFSGAAPH